ncbi:aspartate/glutamate racemase family protein [Thermococcus sp. GR7]|uniref:aspartate/glutamate racemase family protein n=1 Tax=unclassified Thermococcus TaxID=2627626 RepID=UPI00143130F5|nr:MULTISPECIES: aspartate/glutamate racemase family protein [unclassified Thermococcus]NJE47647.1 aspartate/glutamate racemase family protein [Thermococcus sp. GR7]NJE78939.1 aspartate/glutamate racemase family protein [Thermococcus sp. GR4]NJF22589.1 aspartate/glutamate racemase family protein [Thermococcus sp. GR5]
MKRIGIIGGMTPESTCYYYRRYIEISREKFGKHFYPELIIYSINFKEFFENPEGWEGRKKILINAAKALKRAGAEIIAMSANTPHKVFPDVQKEVNVPMVSIIEAVAEEIKRRGIKRVLLLGTKTTMSSDFYVNALREEGFEVVVPSEEEQERLNSIIFNELAFENFRNKAWIVELIERYAREEKVKGVILGCTELPLAIKAGDVSIEVFDTAEIHMRKLIELASE